MARVRWAASAVSNLEDAVEYVARDSRAYAALLAQRAQHAAHTLATFGQRGRRVPETDDPAVREIFVQSYRLIYRITPDEIRVLAFVHGARDLAHALGQGDLPSE